MAVTDVTRFIIVVQFLFLGLYRVVSEKHMIFGCFTTCNVIRICNNKRWEQYQASPGGEIQFLTADVKRRILYWTTKRAFFSLDLDGNKTVVNMSQKFEKGLVYQELLQRTVTLGGIDMRVHDGQIIFAAYNWGLMKFDVETNRRLYSLKNNSDVTKYDLTFSLLNIDVCGNETCLYWHGPDEGQLSRYLINSNINQILVQRIPKDWTPLAVYQTTIYWTDMTNTNFTTDMNIENKVTLMSARLSNSIDYRIIGGIMYYSYERQIPSEFLQTIYPMKSYLSSCPISHAYILGINESNPSTDNHKTVDDQGVVWSTIGWSLGTVFTLIILVIICFRLVKMVRSRVRETNPNPREDVYTLPTRNVSHDHLYKDLKIQVGSEPRYTEVTAPTYIDITESKNIEVTESHYAEIT